MQSSLANQTNPNFDIDIARFTPRQMAAVDRLDSHCIKFLLYGGALGGGKSYFLRWYALRRLMYLADRYKLTRPVAMLACEDYPSLKDRQLQKIAREFPEWLGKMHDDHREYGRCFILRGKWGGGVICFRNLDDPSKYASAEFCLILVDELTKNLYDVFTFLRTRLRWPGLPDVECQFIGATNPGGVGHGWVKQLWMDKIFPDEWKIPIDYRSQFAYIPSKADDNPHLDPSYWSMLSTLPESIRKAFRDGDWNIFLGQAFPMFSEAVHVIDCSRVPENAPLYMTYDWGWGKPFSIGWWWVDADNIVYRFHEWYGWDGTADSGLRMTDSDVARGIKEREKALKIDERSITRLCDPTCFNKKPDYKGGGQGKSTAEIFAEHGLYMSPGDADRKLKIRQFRERLAVKEYPQKDGSVIKRPMMFIDTSCENFKRTIPGLVMDEIHKEDIDTKGEDHGYDEACHICMARPISMEMPKGLRPSIYDRRLEELKKIQTDDTMIIIEREHRDAMRELGYNEYDDAEVGAIMEDRGGPVPTIPEGHR